MSRVVIVLFILALAAPQAIADPAAGPRDDHDGPAPALLGVPPRSPSGADALPLKLGEPSDSWATTRLVSVLVVMVLSVPVLLWARRRRGGLSGVVARAGWLGQLVAEPVAPADRIDVVNRRSLSQREWLAVVRVGDERFLLAATAMRVSLLSRLADAEPEPAAFDVELRTRVAAPTPTAHVEDAPAAPAPVVDAPEDALRTAVARARARLSVLAAADAGMTGRRA